METVKESHGLNAKWVSSIVHFNTRTFVVMSDLRKYHSSIIDLNRSNYWWSAGRRAQRGSIAIAVYCLLRVKHSKEIIKFCRIDEKFFFALTEKFWFWRNNGETILLKQSISLVLLTKNVSRRIKTTTPEKKMAVITIPRPLEMVAFSGRHQIYDCNQKVFYVSGKRAPAGNGTANQRFPLDDYDEILFYHISTDIFCGRGPLYL